MPDDDLIDVLLGLRKVASPEEMPMTVLTRWRIFRTFHFGSESDHFVGVSAESGLVRISTDIVRFDAKSMAGITQSGRLYCLEGPPAEDEDTAHAEAAFARLAMSYGILNIRDVTYKVLADPKNQWGIVQ